MNDIALISASFGGIDDIKLMPNHEGIDAFMYTDEATKARMSSEALASWTNVIVPDYPRADLGARLTSRYFKHQIHRLDQVSGHRWLVWADASIELHQTDFIFEHLERLRCLPPEKRICLIPHPQRDTIEEEFLFIVEWMQNKENIRLRYANEKMPEQMEWFRQQGWRLDAPLWCGTFWMVENNDVINRCWNDWWDQNLRWGMMDQLSFHGAIEEGGCIPQSLEIDLYDNPYFSKVPHRASDGRSPGRVGESGA